MSILEVERSKERTTRALQDRDAATAGVPALKQPHLFVGVFIAWILALAWFHPRMWSLIDLAETPAAAASIAYFVIFAELAWLYGLYNLGIVTFAIIDRRSPSVTQLLPLAARASYPSVAMLYTTCDDFVERSAHSCVALSYPHFHVYILDDSTQADVRREIDAFAARYPDRVTVVRRADRSGFKAGNLNHALANIVSEPYFAIADADEVLPTDFLTRLVPYLEADPKCGFVQANHRSHPRSASKLAQHLGTGIDIHWKWYQPLRNRYGFVMFLGHGAVLRRSCWQEVGGFPEIVSEDLGYAIALRERGFFGAFIEHVVCYEEFPETVRAFRIRHVKWTRGTCEFLHRWFVRLIASRRITTTEKLDILFPTLNLPLTFFFFLFMINAAFVLPNFIGQPHDVTLVIFGREIVLSAMTFRPGVERIFGLDFFAITLATIIAPILCFIIELASKPTKLLNFLARSTALYASLSPLTFVSVVGYALTQRAAFFVTGSTAAHATEKTGLARRLYSGFAQTHPDALGVRAFEAMSGVAFLVAALATVQIGFIGVAIGFMLLPLMHRLGWEHRVSETLVWLPGLFIAIGVCAGALGVVGLQPVLFGFGFHF